MTAAAHELKSCCASAYSSDAARFLLGETFHPGGKTLTRRLVRAVRVGPGDRVVDVASGPGTSALLAAQESGCQVVGVDLAEDNVARATRAAVEAGLDQRVRFVHGDAEALPLPDDFADAVLCECALCTFPNKATAAREFARVLRPGARVAISDITAQTDRLPPQLTSMHAWVACIADARPLPEIAALLETSGLRVETTERRDQDLAQMLDRIEARLKAARLLGAGLLGEPIGKGRELLAAAQDALSAGVLGYGVVIARRPAADGHR